MGYSTSPARFPRNIGSPIQVTWDQSHAASAIINGWPGADFASIVGGESFGVRIDGAATVPVTLIAGDITPTLIAARANAALPGSPFTISAAGNMVFTATTKAEIKDVSEADFALVGLPSMVRDRALTAATSIQLPVTIAGNEIEQVSNAIDVPRGANRASVTVKMTSRLTDLVGFRGGTFLVGWGNGVYGETVTLLNHVPYQAVIDGVVHSIGNDFGQAHQLSFAGQILVIGPVPSGSRLFDYELSVPRGKTKMYVVPWVAKSENPAIAPPYQPPDFEATVAFGAG